MLPKFGFVLSWAILTAVGWVVAALVGTQLGLGGIPGVAVAGLLGGAAIGAFNWFVLRGKINGSGWWILATAVGFGAGLALLGLVGGLVSLLVQNEIAVFIVTYAFCGVIAAVPQWFFLIQRSPRAPWWLAASGLGWGLGLLVVLVTRLADSTAPVYFSSIGAINGLVTGLGLLFLGADSWKKKITPPPRS